MDKCRTSKPEAPGFDALSLELSYAEEHATVMSPLMWSKLQPAGTIA